MNTDRPTPSPYRQTVTLPPFLDRLAAQIAHWPWWAIIVGVGLVIIFYSFLTTDFYRTTLTYLTGNPALVTDRFQEVIYRVRGADGKLTEIQGFITNQNADSVTLIRKDALTFRMPRADVASIDCEGKSGNSDCPVGKPATVTRSHMVGRLLIENLNSFRVQVDDGSVYDVYGLVIESKTKTPPDCTSKSAGGCFIDFKFKPTLPADNDAILTPAQRVSIIRGTLIEANDTRVTVEVIPQLVTIKRSDIAVVSGAKAGQCAINNLTSCNTGISLTILVTLMAFFLAIIVGLLLALMRISSDPLLFTGATIYVEVIRGTPLVVIMLFFGLGIAPWFAENFWHVAPDVGLVLLAISAAAITYYLAKGLLRYMRSRHLPEPMPLIAVFQPIFMILLGTALSLVFTGYLVSNSNTTLETRGVIALTICYSAYLSELFRAGIQSVPRGQMEAARSQGMTYVQAMRYVILPQAFRVVLPPLGNEFIAMLKDTSLLTVLAIPELTQLARNRGADTVSVMEVYAVLAVLYLCMTLFLSFVVRVTERRMGIPR